jgi:LPS sulfotransferase NodH
MTAVEPYDLATERADYPARDGPPERTLVICSHPRSGSTLLGEAIYAAGELGCPLEYLHRGFRPHFAQRWQANDLGAFVRALHRFRTDSTGVMSIKLFWRDVEDVADETAPDVSPDDFSEIFARLQPILPNPTFVYLTRRDRVRQAVSAFVAGETTVFRSISSGEPRASRPVAYDYGGILRQLAAADYANARWRAFFSALRIDALQVDYEDLASNFVPTVAVLLDRLGHAGRPAAPRLRRQATAQSEELVLRFLRDHEAAAVQNTRDSF